VIQGADFSGYHLRLYASKPHAASQEVLRVLGALEVPFRSVEIVDATVADVFALLVGQTEEAA
jgi:hypothetical protein